ncbi:methyltransferase-domain-containing protein [Gloeopeniophorella convolvens]|nr:methyltransferase-domain-containing protein [Gloeopeniophorella convolvens]
MALFEVPGWSVPDAPASMSKKRKRPANVGDQDKVQSAAVNLDKLMNKLAARSGGKHHRKEIGTFKNQERHRKKERPQPKKHEPQHAVAAERNSGTSDPEPKAKKKKKSRDAAETKPDTPRPSSSTRSPPHSPGATLTSLQHGMKQSLDGARFRVINENLYKSDSSQAHAMMREDPAVFSDYHKGFRQQVESWPSNPVSHYISALSSHPVRTVIADLGCGDAALARALIPKGYAVLSFDLVSDGAFITEADIFGHLPLPGSEDDGDDDGSKPGQGHGQVVHVVVCALSLMGTNWPNCLREAWRILRPGGELKIAEVASRFTDVHQFHSLVKSFGFRHRSTDDSNTHFTLFEFQKVGRKSRSEKEWRKILAKSEILKPCEYKRR